MLRSKRAAFMTRSRILSYFPGQLQKGEGIENLAVQICAAQRFTIVAAAW